MPDNILSDKERALRSRIFAEMNIVRIRLEKRVRRLWRDINGQNAPTPAILYEHARLTKILSELKTEMDIASLKLAGVTAKVQEKAIRTATDALNIDLAAFDAKATEALIGFGGLDTKYPLAAMYRRIGKPLAQKVESALVFGVVSGATNHEIAREVRGIMQTTTAHALTIARTETTNAYREASRIAIAKSKQFDGYMWIAALDLRTCPICWRYHGKIFDAKQKFYTHPNCVISGTVVSSPEILATSKRWYSGEVVEIVTASGKRLTVTPNHPVMTPQGWIAGGLLNQGGEVIGTAMGKGMGAVYPNDHHKPAVIDEIVEAFRQSSSVPSVPVPASTEYFHGDGQGGKIDIVLSDGFLRSGIDPAFGQPVEQGSLIDGDAESVGFPRLGSFGKFGVRPFPATNGIVQGRDVSGVFDACPFGHHQSIGGDLVSRFNTGFYQPKSDGVAGDAEMFGKGVFGLSADVSRDNFFDWQGGSLFQVEVLVAVHRRHYDGFVFNLETVKGRYIADGIVTHNCRCTLVAVSPDMEPVETGPQAFAKLTDAQKRTILGKGKFELYKAGYALEQMTGLTKTAYGHSPVILDLDTISKKKPLQALETLENGISSQPIGTKQPRKPKTQRANTQETVTGFPLTLNELTEVKSLGGSTGAKLVQDSTGRQFVLKGGASEDHIREEYLADTVYQAFGVPVPKTKIYVADGGRVYKLSEFIDGKPLNQLTGTAFEKAKAELQKDFHIDALLSNRDVIGLSQDNILVDKAGKVWRIDNGSSFRFRAQGGPKEYDSHLSDLWTMRDAKINPQSARVFGNVKIYDLAKRMEIASTAEMRARIVAMVPADLKPALNSRFDQMRDVAKYAREFETNDWADQNYTDEVLQHVVGLRKAGITGRLPQKLAPKSGGEPTHLYDENGYKFDSLRKRTKFGKMIPDLFEDYMRANGGNPDVIAEWQSDQAGNSWNSKAQGFKFFVGTKLTSDAQQDVLWRNGGRSNAKSAYEKMVSNFGRETVERSHAQMKALVMELLEHTEMPNVDRNARTVRLVRTEAVDVVAQYGLVKDSTLEQKIVRGLSESYSLVRRTSIHGSEITVQDVAFTDIHGLYILNRAGYGADTGAFLGDGENEVAALWRYRKHKLRYIKPSELRAFGFEP